MTERRSQRELIATEQDIERAHQIVYDELGGDFSLEYGTLPRSVGVLGDEGVRGDTLLIICNLADPVRFLTENYEKIEKTANRLCNETGAATRVLFDITHKTKTSID